MNQSRMQSNNVIVHKPKVLILYNKLFHYRIPIWNLLAEKCDLTVVYCEGGMPEGIHCDFVIKHISYKKIGPLVWHNANVCKMVKDYDAVIVYGDISWVKYMALPWFGNSKVAYWTIGVSTSQGYDMKRQKDFLFRFFYKKAKALIFYSDQPIERYVKNGFKRTSLFVANNTVEVSPIIKQANKDTIVFIGTLHKRKGLFLLLDVYKTLKDSCQLPKLVIVGDGPEYDNIHEWILQNEMSVYVEMKGGIIDKDKKSEVLSHALACISPKQAGLSVLECMGCGVPFVTTKNSITGGERFNIHSGVDGVIMEDEAELKDVVLDIASNPNKYIKMGLKAKEFYESNRTPHQMADGLWQAIQYLIGNGKTN